MVRSQFKARDMNFRCNVDRIGSGYMWRAIGTVRGILMMVIVYVLPGCGSLRDLGKDKEIIRTSSDSSVAYTGLTKQHSRRMMEATVMSRDSMEADYTFEVWPKGKFSYSPEMGFEGEALKVTIRGSQKKTSAIAALQLVEDEVSRVDDQRLQSQHRSESLEKTVQVRRTFGWKMIVCILVLGAMLIKLHNRQGQ